MNTCTELLKVPKEVWSCVVPSTFPSGVVTWEEELALNRVAVGWNKVENSWSDGVIR